MTTEPTREEVQAHLDALELAAKHGEQDATLIALCRAWLALHDAPLAEVDDDEYLAAYPIDYKEGYESLRKLLGKTVRLVAVEDTPHE